MDTQASPGVPGAPPVAVELVKVFQARRTDVADAQSNFQIEPPPSFRCVTKAISNVLRELRNAHAEVIEHRQGVTTQRQRLDEDRRRITADQEELSGLRSEVEARLADLGATAEIPSPNASTRSPDENGSGASRLHRSSRSAVTPSAAQPIPKTGGGSSTAQFRKLRRDAKRKSIGL